MRPVIASCGPAALFTVLAWLPLTTQAIQFCPLPDGSMGKACTTSDGTVYGCVKDLKECGALSPVKPGAGQASKHREPTPATPPTQPKPQRPAGGG